MAKKKMACPFSGKLCTDCAIYRGRHYYLCFKTGYRGCLWQSNEFDEQATKARGSDDKKFEMPDDFQTSSRWIKDVEDLIEIEELETFEERRGL